MKIKLEVLILFLSLSCLFLTSCIDDTIKENECKTCEWVKEAKKPIQCLKHEDRYEHGYSKYTLIDSIGNIFSTHEVYLVLPPTLK